LRSCGSSLLARASIVTAAAIEQAPICRSAVVRRATIHGESPIARPASLGPLPAVADHGVRAGAPTLGATFVERPTLVAPSIGGSGVSGWIAPVGAAAIRGRTFPHEEAPWEGEGDSNGVRVYVTVV
jgi:hypothetical protein